jgi:hypothetical protein
MQRITTKNGYPSSADDRNPDEDIHVQDIERQETSDENVKRFVPRAKHLETLNSCR